MPLRFTKKWFSDKDDNVVVKKREIEKSILRMYGFAPFGHEDYYKSYVSDTMANALTPKKLEINISQQDLSPKIMAWLYKNDFQSKNWINEKRASDIGISAFLIFLNQGIMNFQPIRVAEREYDVLGNLIQCTIFYDDYKKNNLNLRMYETYQLENSKVKITREIYELSTKKIVDNNGASKLEQTIIKVNDFEKQRNNEKLNINQVLEINYIPIAIFSNLPSERADIAGVEDKLKALDIFYEQSILDAILNATRFLINTNSLVGNVQKNVNKIIDDFIKNHVLVMNYDQAQNPIPFSTINGQFRGKELTYLYDWNVTEINKRIGMHVPAIHKGAQQTRQESSAVNIQTNNMLEQKLLLREEAHANFIYLLLKFDRDLNGNSFISKELEKMTIKVNLNVTTTIGKEINNIDMKGQENGGLED
ncbi:hypothetical protein [Spiroplasma endosymbiont of Clivina fossor]|uniref:hypothetical protein n=1 Tax=Spiroplasma endosymbiont of Clivina fossor TaxID=3066282 RepID=UPI00313C0F88